MISAKRESKKVITRNTTHKVKIKQVYGDAPKIVYRKAVRQAILTTLKSEAVDIPCSVSVLITDDRGIRDYNVEYRYVDKATDVLSFPMQRFDKPGWHCIGGMEVDRDTGMLPLGDIIISQQHIKRQARARGHSVMRETAHLTIHSTLHLLGYDHDNKDNNIVMRRKEKCLLRKLGYMSIRAYRREKANYPRIFNVGKQ